MGMGFADALVDHSDARVAIVDRRHGAGGHWLEDYPFVRLHQSSTFYGVASTVLGGHVQEQGPEAGLHVRASQPEIVDYYARARRAAAPHGPGRGAHRVRRRRDRTVVSRISGRTWEVPASCRVVNAHYLAPSIPAESSAPFSVADDARAVTVNDVVRLEEAPSQYVVVGSGKTATDACVWLLGQGVDPDAICWVRPRDPWMLNRALIQPDPEVFLGVPATTLRGGRGLVVARRAVPPPGGRRRDAAHRPVGHAHDGEGPDARRVGARAAAVHRERRTPRAPAQRGARSPRARGRHHRAGRGRRGRGALRRRRPEEPAARVRLAPGGHHGPAGARGVPVLQCGR